mmetsp:Transcript_131692/g.421332  ORF Transcript_131692/g.421332 Transcript_131692/m.421332 type:complete len:174 (+) Transcript_131692:99-620(+)
MNTDGRSTLHENSQLAEGLDQTPTTHSKCPRRGRPSRTSQPTEWPKKSKNKPNNGSDDDTDFDLGAAQAVGLRVPPRNEGDNRSLEVVGLDGEVLAGAMRKGQEAPVHDERAGGEQRVRERQNDQNTPPKKNKMLRPYSPKTSKSDKAPEVKRSKPKRAFASMRKNGVAPPAK